jgi:hypothetical protein
MTLHSNGLFRLWAASGCIDHHRMACFAFGATIHFVRHSKVPGAVIRLREISFVEAVKIEKK